MIGNIFVDIENPFSELKDMEKLLRLKRIPESVGERIFEFISNKFEESFSCVDVSTSSAGDLVFRFGIIGELKDLISTFRTGNFDFI